MRAIIVEGTEEEIAALVIETRERRFELPEPKPQKDGDGRRPNELVSF